MALKLAKDLKNAAAANVGFDLQFTEGLTYDLDELISNKSRIDANRGLVVEIKKSREIAEQAMEDLKNELTTTIEATLYKVEVNDKIREIIKDVFLEYNASATNITSGVAKEISFRANSYLKSLYNDFNVDFEVYYAGMTDSIKITYNFVSNDELNEYFGKHYDILSDKYAESMNVSEGGLAITDSSSKVRVNKNDYSKYLLDKCGESYTKKPSEIGVSATKIRINWEDGTEDTTLPSQVHTIYDEISFLKNKVDSLEELLESTYDSRIDNLEESNRRMYNNCSFSNDGDFPHNIYQFKKVNNELHLIKYLGAAEELYIPSTIDGLAVTAIERTDSWNIFFDECGQHDNVRKIYIPPSIKNIISKNDSTGRYFPFDRCNFITDIFILDSKNSKLDMEQAPWGAVNAKIHLL